MLPASTQTCFCVLTELTSSLFIWKRRAFAYIITISFDKILMPGTLICFASSFFSAMESTVTQTIHTALCSISKYLLKHFTGTEKQTQVLLYCTLVYFYVIILYLSNAC